MPSDIWKGLLRRGADRPIFPGSGQVVAPWWRVRAENGCREPAGSSGDPDSGEGLGGLHEGGETGRGWWERAARQAQVGENFENHRGIFDRREEGQRAAALRTGGNVDGEDALSRQRVAKLPLRALAAE